MQGAKIVGSEICESISTHDIDILCMQEPHSVNGQISGMPSTARVATGCSENPKTAISIHSVGMDMMKLTQACDSHCTCVEISSEAGSFYLLSIYAQYSEPIEYHLCKIETILGSLSGQQKKVMIVGDFNARSKMWHDRLTDENGRKVEDFVSRNDLFIMNLQGHPTTFSSNGNSNIDLTIVNGALLGSIVGWRVRENWTSSDHRVITFELSNAPQNSPLASNKIPRFAIKIADWGLFARQLVGSWDSVEALPEINSIEEIDDRVELITTQLTSVCNNSIPKKRVAKRQNSWWNSNLRKLRSSMHKLRRAYQKERNQIAKELKLSLFRAARNKYFHEVFIAKQSSFQRYVTEHGNNDPWGLVYKFAAGKARPPEVLNTIRKTSGVVTDTWHDTRLELLNSLLPDETPDVTGPQAEMREIATNNSWISDAEDPPFTWEEVNSALTCFKRNKSPGLDNLNAEIIQLAWPIIGTSIVRLLNSCLKFGYFPKAWKKGEMIIIKKPGDRDPLSPKSYRPIMLLPVMGKLLERLLAVRISPRIEQSGLFSDKQFGFRRSMSTEDAIVRLTNTVKTQSSKYVMGIFLDIAGAFDNLTWPSVIASLSVYNLPGNIINVFKSYFSNRTAEIRDKYGSVTKQVTKGCPQGSILGPLIWNIVFNTSMMNDQDEIAFADDKVILVHGNSRLELQRQGQTAINNTIRWCETNKMSLSVEKTVMLQLKGKFDSSRPPTISLNGRNMKMVKCVRYLGVDLDERMGVTSHVLRVCENAKKLFHSLARVSREGWGLNHKTLVIIYKGVAEAQFTYAAAGWYDRLNCHHIRSLESAQRNILLGVTKAYRTVSKDAVVVLAGVLPVDILIKKRALMYHLRRSAMNESGDHIHVADSERIQYRNKNEIAQMAVDLWQRRWNESANGRHTFAFIPDVKVRLKMKPQITSSVSQVISGHGKFKAYLQRFKIINHCRCPCGSEVEDVNHLLFECNEVTVKSIKQKWLGNSNIHELSLPKLLSAEVLPQFRAYCAELISVLKERNSALE